MSQVRSKLIESTEGLQFLKLWSSSQSYSIKALPVCTVLRFFRDQCASGRLASSLACGQHFGRSIIFHMQEQEPACADRIRCEVTERFKSGALYVETVAIDIWYVAEGCPQAVSIMNLFNCGSFRTRKSVRTRQLTSQQHLLNHEIPRYGSHISPNRCSRRIS